MIIPGSLHSRMFLRQQYQQGRLIYPAYSEWSRAASQAEWIALMALSRARVPGVDGFIYSPPPALREQNLSVGVSPDDFGRVGSIPLTDPWTAPGPSTYTLLLGNLTNNGYRPGINLFVAAYDWRLDPKSLAREGYFARLKNLIESASLSNNNSKVVVLTHSAGGPLALTFFHTMSTTWKDSYISSFVSINGNFGGEIDCLENLWNGGDFLNAAMNVTFWDRPHYRATQWTWPITSWCLPDERIFGSAPLVALGSGPGALQFSAQNLTLLFREVRAPALEDIFPTVANLTHPGVGPGTEVFCMCGTGLKTPVHYAFPTGNFSEPPTVTFASGDGQQSDATNMVCGQWPRSKLVTFKGADHDALLSTPDLVHYLLEGPLLPG